MLLSKNSATFPSVRISIRSTAIKMLPLSIIIASLAVFASPVQAANNVEIKLNGGAGPNFNAWNILEIWIENDQPLAGMEIAFEFSGVSGIAFDNSYGSHGYVNLEPAAVGAWDAGFFVNTSIDGSMPDSIGIEGFAIASQLPASSSRLCYSMRVWLPSAASTVTNGFCIDPIVWPVSGIWLFGPSGKPGLPPDFQGNSTGSMTNPSAPPVCYDIIGCGPLPAPTNFGIFAQDDRFGAAIAGGRDISLTPDGIPDYAVGAPIHWISGGRRGSVRIFDGQTDVEIVSLYGEGLDDEFGFSLAMSGDMTGDGRAQLIVGAPNHFNSTASARIGRVYVWQYNGSSWSHLYSVSAGSAGDRFGHAVASGDHNGDGIDDFVIGVPLADPGGRTDAGIIYVISGADGTVLATFEGASVGDSLGWSVDAGDFDDDGKADIIAGAPGGNYVKVFRTAVSDYWAFHGFGEKLFGWSVCYLGDLDGDGNYEFVAGAPGDGVWSGNQYISKHSLSLDGQSSSSVGRSIGVAGDATGLAVCSIDDVNGDCVRDIAVGAPYNSDLATRSGKTYILSGISFSHLDTLFPTQSLDYAAFGFAIAEVGDRDRDGWRNFMVGAPIDFELASGRVYEHDLNQACLPLCSCCLLRGNVNGNGPIDISDLTYLVAYMFGGGPPAPCEEEADVNGDFAQDISDLTYFVAYSFGGGPAPVACP